MKSAPLIIIYNHYEVIFLNVKESSDYKNIHLRQEIQEYVQSLSGELLLETADWVCRQRTVRQRTVHS